MLSEGNRVLWVLSFIYGTEQLKPLLLKKMRKNALKHQCGPGTCFTANSFIKALLINQVPPFLVILTAWFLAYRCSLPLSNCPMQSQP